ncbi:hypothetical protein RND81_10G104200 [Saponaria officinalis]|uniref:Uncharacterized protein n=1 Tax=Saponaria officinalis TaxID=3572 RepID=A0AAW1I2Q1_SAPOF
MLLVCTLLLDGSPHFLRWLRRPNRFTPPEPLQSLPCRVSANNEAINSILPVLQLILDIIKGQLEQIRGIFIKNLHNLFSMPLVPGTISILLFTRLSIPLNGFY